MGIKLNLFSCDGEPLGRVRALGATHEEGLDGTDTLTVDTFYDLQKGQRVLWKDVTGTIHEHIVDSTERTHNDAGKPITRATCINSIAETYGDYIDDTRPSQGASVSAALGAYIAASGTRWTLGPCDDIKTSGEINAYHTTLREAISNLVEKSGGEVETTITVEGGGVKTRAIGIRAAKNAEEDDGGGPVAKHRFTYSKQLTSVKKTVKSEEVKTAMYGYGKGTDTDGDGNYGRRLDFSSINGGKKYVEDAAALDKYGRKDADGNRIHNFGVIVFDQCEKADELLKATQDYLKTVNHPQVSYECEITDIASIRDDLGKPVKVGEYVDVVDEEDGLRMRERVTTVKRDLTGFTTGTVTIGNTDSEFVRKFTQLEKANTAAEQQQADMSGLENKYSDLDSRLSSLENGGMGGGDGWTHVVTTAAPAEGAEKTIYFVTG